MGRLMDCPSKVSPWRPLWVPASLFFVVVKHPWERRARSVVVSKEFPDFCRIWEGFRGPLFLISEITHSFSSKQFSQQNGVFQFYAIPWTADSDQDNGNNCRLQSTTASKSLSQGFLCIFVLLYLWRIQILSECAEGWLCLWKVRLRQTLSLYPELPWRDLSVHLSNVYLLPGLCRLLLNILESEKIK